MSTIRFEQVYSQRLGISTFCVRCGKKLKRTIREEQTINPWNTIEEDGVKRPKTHREAWEECETAVKARVATLKANGTLCRYCEELGTPATPDECYVKYD